MMLKISKCVIIFIIFIVISYFMTKKVLQALIIHNYKCRMQHQCSDKWYWADLLYIKMYGLDYDFAETLKNIN